MLLEIIRFEIHDSANNRLEHFTVANTVENQERIFSHRNTRDITFDRMQDFQFEREMMMPAEFISEVVWGKLANTELFAAAVAELEVY